MSYIFRLIIKVADGDKERYKKLCESYKFHLMGNHSKCEDSTRCDKTKKPLYDSINCEKGKIVVEMLNSFIKDVDIYSKNIDNNQVEALHNSATIFASKRIFYKRNYFSLSGLASLKRNFGLTGFLKILEELKLPETFKKDILKKLESLDHKRINNKKRKTEPDEKSLRLLRKSKRSKLNAKSIKDNASIKYKKGCGCKSGCSSKRCSCFKDEKTPCQNGVCKCINCKNQIPDSDIQTITNSSKNLEDVKSTEGKFFCTYFKIKE
jgi:hypothetical protein